MRCENHVEREGTPSVQAAGVLSRPMCAECKAAFTGSLTQWKSKREAWHTDSFREDFGGRSFHLDNKYLNPNHIYHAGPEDKV